MDRGVKINNRLKIIMRIFMKISKTLKKLKKIMKKIKKKLMKIKVKKYQLLKLQMMNALMMIKL